MRTCTRVGLGTHTCNRGSSVRRRKRRRREGASEITAELRRGECERIKARREQESGRSGEKGRDREGKRERRNPTIRVRRVRERAEKRVASEGGTRVDRVTKTTGSQVIIKCNQYFTYFSRKAEGRLTPPSTPHCRTSSLAPLSSLISRRRLM